MFALLNKDGVRIQNTLASSAKTEARPDDNYRHRDR